MIQFSGPIPKEKAARLRKLAEKYGIKKVARCRFCAKDSKNFDHMAMFELKRYFDIAKNRFNYQFIGLCMDCVERSHEKSLKTINPTLINGIITESLL